MSRNRRRSRDRIGIYIKKDIVISIDRNIKRNWNRNTYNVGDRDRYRERYIKIKVYI